MAQTLFQYWTDEATRLGTRLASVSAQLAALRGTPAVKGPLDQARDSQLAAGKALTAQQKALDDARRALSGIPMPADGDPLLDAMETALIGVADARADLARHDRAVQQLSAEAVRLEAQQTALQAAKAAAEAAAKQAKVDADLRQTWVDALTTGALKNLKAQATTALAAETAARKHVEGEFPAGASDATDLLKRAKARRDLVLDSLAKAVDVEAAAHVATDLDKAQAAFDAAVDAVRRAFGAAPRLAADTATLARLAALPDAHPSSPESYPILTVWQHKHLHDTTLSASREAALGKLTNVDTAAAALRKAQFLYDKALHAAQVANPEKTVADLDAGPLKTLKQDVTDADTALGTARGKLSPDEQHTVKAWFATVPDTLWSALDQLEAAVTRLKDLSGAGAPAGLITAMVNAEDALVTALTTARKAASQQGAAARAAQRAADLLSADRETAVARSAAFEHGAALF